MTLQRPATMSATMPVPVASSASPKGERPLARLQERLSRVLIGKAPAIELFLAGVLSGGHILIEDVPGVGKTMLAKAFARAINGQLRRIQCTPDLLPTDIIGVSVYNPHERAFQFQPGPVFGHVLLADEINRASPRTQAALLEAMGEKQVSVDGQSLPLAPAFCVIATQNPIEAQGTYPLPEAQLDRFAMQIALGYPPASEARRLLLQPDDQERLDSVETIFSSDDLVALQQTAARIPIEDSVADYLLALVEATRCHAAVQLGVSPRGALALLAVARGRALLHERDFVTPDDVKALAVAALAHRPHSPVSGPSHPQCVRCSCQGSRGARHSAASESPSVSGPRGRALRFCLIYLRQRLTPAGYALCLIWLLAALQGSTSFATLLLHIWSFTTVCLALAWLISHFAMPNLTLTRRQPPPVTAGNSLTYEVEIINRSPRAAYGLHIMEMHIPAGLQSMGAVSAPVIERLAPRAAMTLTLQLNSVKRGCHPLPGLLAASSYPLGLFRACYSRGKTPMRSRTRPMPSCTPSTCPGNRRANASIERRRAPATWPKPPPISLMSESTATATVPVICTGLPGRAPASPPLRSITKKPASASRSSSTPPRPTLATPRRSSRAFQPRPALPPIFCAPALRSMALPLERSFSAWPITRRVSA